MTPTPDAMPDEVLEAMADAIDETSGALPMDNVRSALTAAASMGWCMRDECPRPLKELLAEGHEQFWADLFGTGYKLFSMDGDSIIGSHDSAPGEYGPIRYGDCPAIPIYSPANAKQEHGG